MTRRVMSWISGLVRETRTESEVHFHQGSGSHPAVCFDARCGSPRLDVSQLA
jgi:hypothetical protein